MLELIAGIAVAIAALVLVVQPLLVRQGAGELASGSAQLEADDDFIIPEESDSPKISALLALREIEFDRATGKLSDEDYARLKATYSAAALAAIAADDQSAATPGDRAPVASGDAAELLIQRARTRAGTACPRCGPRPEPGAVFCSSCGRSLVALIAQPRCWVCGSDLPDDARFCANCGKKFAA